MFAEWVSIGVAFGVKAFFAIFTFGAAGLAAAGSAGDNIEHCKVDG